MTTINETKSPFEIRQSREKFLTALTLFSGVIASLLFTRENFQFLSIALFAIAYIAGGYYGVIDSLELLSKITFEGSTWINCFISDMFS